GSPGRTARTATTGFAAATPGASTSTPISSSARRLSSAAWETARAVIRTQILRRLSSGNKSRKPAADCALPSRRSRPNSMGRATYSESGLARESRLPPGPRPLVPGPIQPAFDALAETYNETFTRTLIGRAQRDAVWRELARVFRPGQRICEINCGTGVDAVYLAARGVQVLACDSSPRMIEVARKRLADTGYELRAPVHFEVLAMVEIGSIDATGLLSPFVGAFSYFAGL